MSEDAIYRQGAINTLADMYCKSDEDGYVWIIRSDAWARIDALPSAQPERKKGYYVGEANGYADGELVYDIWSCSECGCHFEDWDKKPTYNYCPNCGALMEKSR